MTRVSRLSGTFCLVLFFGCVPYLHGLSASPEVADVAGLLAGFPQFRRLAESELSSQMKREDMNAMIVSIENAAVDVAFTDDRLVALTLAALESGQRQGLPSPLVFQSVLSALRRLKNL